MFIFLFSMTHVDVHSTWRKHTENFRKTLLDAKVDPNTLKIPALKISGHFERGDGHRGGFQRGGFHRGDFQRGGFQLLPGEAHHGAATPSP